MVATLTKSPKTLKTKFEKRIINLMHYFYRFEDGHLEEDTEMIAFPALVLGGLALHGVYGRAKVYWNITHILSGRKLTIRPKKFVRVPDAKGWLEYAANMFDWTISRYESLKDGETQMRIILDLIAAYPDDLNNQDEDEDDEDEFDGEDGE